MSNKLSFVFDSGVCCLLLVSETLWQADLSTSLSRVKLTHIVNQLHSNMKPKLKKKEILDSSEFGTILWNRHLEHSYYYSYYNSYYYLTCPSPYIHLVQLNHC